MKRALLHRPYIAALILAQIVLLLFGGLGYSQGKAVSAALPPLEPVLASGWKFQRPDAPLTFSLRMEDVLQLDAAGNPKVVIGGDHLYYAYKDQTGWHTETIDEAWNQDIADLALDAAGHAHISYFDSENKDLKYATNKSGAWQIQTVLSEGIVGMASEIAIDSNGSPAIVYYNSTTDELRYIRYLPSTGTWGQDELIFAGLLNWDGGWFSFTLDTSTPVNTPHVSFYFYTEVTNPSGSLYYATYSTPNVWSTTLIDSCGVENPCHAGGYNSLALNPITKKPSIAYSYDGSPAPSLVYRTFDGSNWQKETIQIPFTIAPKKVALVIDFAGTAHITYTNDGLYYIQRTGENTWTTPYAIDPDPDAGGLLSLALNGSHPKVVYYNHGKKQMLYADHDLTGWKDAEPIISQGHNVGVGTSLVVDRLGRSHIGYFDWDSKSLLYVRDDGSKNWTKSTIDNSGTASSFFVIAVDPVTSEPRAGLLKGGSLYYSVYKSGAWQPSSLVDSNVYNFDLEILPDGSPAFAYINNSIVYYTTLSGSNWIKTEVAPAWYQPEVQLEYDPDNNPHILFFDGMYTQHVFNESGEWVIESLDTGEADFAIGPKGQMMAVGIRAGHYLFFTSRTNNCDPLTKKCEWTPSELSYSYCYSVPSLEVDADGTPHIACNSHYRSRDELHYLTRKGGVWEAYRVDISISTGGYPSLALSLSGKPRISYQEMRNQDLMFAQALDMLYVPSVSK